jgi:ABC transporter substrate binding protein
VTSGFAVPAAKQVTSDIPIVFALASDPVGTGMIASLARPGGNVTGLSQQSRELAGKRLELLREIVPALRRLAAMGNVGSPTFALEIGDVQAAARALGLDVATFEIRRAEDIVPAFAAIKDRADALYVIGSDPLIVPKRVSINTLAAAARFPTVHSAREYVEAGGLLSLWSKLRGPVPARRQLRRQDSARGEAGRDAGRAADQVRSCRQPDHRQGAGADDPRIVPAARRRGDRIEDTVLLRLLTAAYGTKRTRRDVCRLVRFRCEADMPQLGGHYRPVANDPKQL